MRAPLSWLQDFAPFGDDVTELAANLDDLGLVVERVERVGEGLGDLVVAQVLEIGAIEGADKIRRVTVEAGGGPQEVVCGAWNFQVGDLVPLAPVGAVLPGGLAIKRRKMKGVVSNGMLCSGRELELSEDHEGIMVLDPAEAAVGQALTEALGIQPDVIFELTVEGDRPDAWSMVGVARDLAARLKLPFDPPDPPEPPTGGPSVHEETSVVVHDPDLCPRFTACVLRGVQVGPSPRWLARRLTLAGMRPINNVVDASNYVMLELGQPTHPYDRARLGGGGLVVRRARPGETVVTLDGLERQLGVPGPGLGDSGEDCVICDADDRPVGIGGIMGGASSEIGPETHDVVLETAYFDPLSITRTATRLALRSEASARFERGTDPWGIDRAIRRLVGLLVDQGAVSSVAPGILDVRGEVPGALRQALRVEEVNRLLGTALHARDIEDLLSPIGFQVTEQRGGESRGQCLEVTVPTARPDVRPFPLGRADLIEEVARTHGYANIPRRQPAWPQPGRLAPRQRERRALREVLAGLGALEVWTNSLVSPCDHEVVGLVGPAVELANPQQSEETVLRRSLLPGMLGALVYNDERREGEVRLFEVGTVFSHPDEPSVTLAERRGDSTKGALDIPLEREMAGVVLAGRGDDARSAVAAWSVVAEALGLAKVTLVAPAPDLLGHQALGPLPGLHPTRSAWLVSGSAIVGSLGEVDPEVLDRLGWGATEVGARRVGWVELDLDRLLDPAVVARRPAQVHPVSRYPSSDVDVALVVDDAVPADRVAATLRRAGGALVESLRLFDVFRSESLGAGRRSLAYRLRFCALDHTLTDQEVAAARAACIEAAAKEHGAELRA